MCRGGRTSDIVKLRGDGLGRDGIYWRAGKGIKDASGRKVVILKDEWIKV